jgi:hypothetical protein
MSGLRIGGRKIQYFERSIPSLLSQSRRYRSTRRPPKMPVEFSSVIFLVGKDVLIGSPMTGGSFEELDAAKAFF